MNTKQSIAFFDLDGTLINGDSYSTFIKTLNNKNIVPKDYFKKDSNFLQKFFDGTLDIIEFYRFALAPLKGYSKDDLADILDSYLKEYLKPKIYTHAIDLMKLLKSKGYKIIIVSATFDLLVDPIAYQIFEADEAIGTTVLYDNNGKILGDVSPNISHQAGKVSRLMEVIEKKNYTLENSYAFGDSINDLQLLSIATHPFACNPEEKFKQIALDKNWPIISFKESVLDLFK